MNSERHDRAKALFATARELSPEQAADFLDAACGEDRDLSREVAVLLALHRELEGAEAPLPKLEMVGHFRALRLVGEGGMGEVWEAEQETPVRRRVALKLVKWGMNTKEVLARFEAERQALALMHHPNIASVYEAGANDDGRPFFAMEFVDGVNIVDYCDSGRLSINDRLQLFLDVCEGVQHAHHKGVIHRDIKPSNVLVATDGGRPLPKIIDFGVAKAISQRLTERTVATQLGHWIGTPEYMSPEQASISETDVDTRSDVYSLGVLLYELLAGVPPLDPGSLREASFDEMRRRICEDEALRPSTRVGRSSADSIEAAEKRRTDVAGLSRALRGDLDWIALKALEKDPARRYRSPSELAADIGRHLRHEPVVASPPSSLYRIGRYVRRNRLAVAAGTVAMIALLSGAAAASIGLFQARREAETSRVVSNILESVILDLNPRSRTGSAARVADVIDRGVERTRSELADRPVEMARLMTALGVARAGLGDVEGARPLLEWSAELRLRHLGPDHLDYAASCFYLGDVMIDLGLPEAAKDLHEKAFAIRQKRLPTYHRLLAFSAERVAVTSGMTEDCEKALDFVSQVLAVTEWNGGVVDPEVESVMLGAANVAGWCNDLDLARSVLEQTRVFQEGAREPRNLGDVAVLLKLASVLDQLGDASRAAELSERAVSAWKDLGGPEDRDFAAGLFVAGQAHLNAGLNERAREYFDMASDLDRRVASGSDELGRWRLELARQYVRMGDPEAAVDLLRQAVRIGLPVKNIADDPALTQLFDGAVAEAPIADGAQ